MHLNAHLDFDVLALETDDTVTVMLELEAPKVSDDGAERPAHTTIVVLDRSGSMGGERLEAAKRALADLVARLDDRDQFGLVTFDHQAQVVVPAGPVGASGRDELRRLIAAIAAGGSTDLCAGYLRGLQEAKRAAGPTGATLLLLSDGHANVGESDPHRLRALAQNHADKLITTSTIGIGVGYDEAILAELATGGLGNHSFAQGPDDAIAAVAGEVEGLLSKAVQAATLMVDPTADVATMSLLNDLPLSITADGVMIELGDFYAGESRRILLTFHVPALASLGLAQIASIALTYVELPALTAHTVKVPVSINVVPGDVAAGRVPEPEVTRETLLIEAQESKRAAEHALRQGDYEAAQAELQRARSRFSDDDVAASAFLAEEADWIDRTLGMLKRDQVQLRRDPRSAVGHDDSYLLRRMRSSVTRSSRGYRSRTQGGEVHRHEDDENEAG
ncbi:MAG: VWA domain-containing protein [Candidatus Nanopelagicales bacterium]